MALANILRRVKKLELKTNGIGLFLVEDNREGLTVKISNMFTGFKVPNMDRDEARDLVHGKPCLWLGLYNGHVPEGQREQENMIKQGRKKPMNMEQNIFQL